MLWTLDLVVVEHALAADVIDRVVAVVDGQPVLESEVAFDAELDARLGYIDPGLGSDPLDRAIHRAAVRHAAERIALNQPSDDLLRAEVERVRLGFQGTAEWAAFLDRFGLDEAGLFVWTRRRLIVSRWIDRQVSGLPRDRQVATASGVIADLVASAAVRRVEPRP